MPVVSPTCSMQPRRARCVGRMKRQKEWSHVERFEANFEASLGLDQRGHLISTCFWSPFSQSQGVPSSTTKVNKQSGPAKSELDDDSAFEPQPTPRPRDTMPRV